MGLLLGISKDDIANFTVAKPDGMGGYVDDTYENTLGADTWDANINHKKMLEWVLDSGKHGKIHVVITKTPVISFGALDLHYNITPGTLMPDSLNPNAGLGTTRNINSGSAIVNLATGNISGSWDGVEHWPVDTPMPGDPAHDAPFTQGWGPVASIITTSQITADEGALLTPATTRDDLIDYEALVVNFKSLLCEVTRNKADPGFNQSDYRAQGVSATKYSQVLFLFEDATGCSGLYFGGSRHDFRRTQIAALTLFGIRVQTGDGELTDPFEWTGGDVTKHRLGSTTPGTISYVWTDAIGSPNYTATIPYGLGNYDLKLHIVEEFA